MTAVLHHHTPAHYDQFADAYDAHFQDAKSLAENRAVARWVAPYLRTARRVVDLGCGTGLLLDLVSIASTSYTGIDISPAMLDHARAKHPGHRFVVGDIEADDIAGVSDESADFVASLFGSVSYCNLIVARDTVARLLAPEGRYFVMICGPRYPMRRSFIDAGGGRLHVHPASRVIEAYRPDTVWGMSCSIDSLPSGTPRWIYDAAIRLERETVGKFMLDSCYFLVLSGRRASLPVAARPARETARRRSRAS